MAHHVHVNPIFESVSCVKKKLFAKLKFTGFRTEDDDEDEDDDAAQTKSLSIDSMYITPSNNEETEEKLIQATNYFIASALIASAVLAIIIVWLFVGMHSFLLFALSCVCVFFYCYYPRAYRGDIRSNVITGSVWRKHLICMIKLII